MSAWEQYCDAIIPPGANQAGAAIFGKALDATYADKGFGINMDQLRKVTQLMNTPNDAFAQGFHVGSEKFQTVACENTEDPDESANVLVGKKGENSCCFCKTERLLLCSRGDVEPRILRSSVEKYAETLRDSGF